ncbi:MAG: hypothetical protein JNM20_01970, partial [Rhizobiales bacterium]|nr:hypothetical protein [Hyphomicrobiales bacterium]
GQFEKFRRGSFYITRLAFDEAWTMDDSVQPLFPVPSCVVFARRRATAKPVPDTVTAYSGELPYRDSPEEIADKRLKVRVNAPIPAAGQFEGGSPYRKAFRQGATLVPRMLCLVERRSSGGILGGDASRPHVASRRTTQEKAPWKFLLGIEGAVESEFLRPVLLGESILPYRVFQTFEGVVPSTPEGKILDAEAAATRGLSGLSGWMRSAEAVWNEDRPSPISFVQQLDYYGKLASQFPLSDTRVLYAKAGTIPAACVLRDSAPVIDHMLYWIPVSGELEGRYLAAILNSETVRKRIERLQSRGQWGARHFDKVMFTLPIPLFDPDNALHCALAEAAEEAERIAASVPLPDNVKFQRARKLVRDALSDAGIAQRIDALVARLLDGD